MPMPWNDKRVTDDDLLSMLGFGASGAAHGAASGHLATAERVRKTSEASALARSAADGFIDSPFAEYAERRAADTGKAASRAKTIQKGVRLGGGVAGAAGGAALAYVLAKLRHREEDRR